MKLDTHILFHRFTPWNSEIRCSTKIFAEQFISHEFLVSYVQALIHPFRLIYKRHRTSSLNGITRTHNLQIVSPFTLFPYSKWIMSSKMADTSYLSILPSLKKTVGRKFGDPKILWTVPPGSSALKLIFPKAKLVMQVVDYYPAFLGERVKEIEKLDYRRADHIFTVGHSLKTYLIEELGVPHGKVSVLGQGVDNFRYHNQLKEPEDLRHAPHDRFVYLGLLSKCDQGMMIEVANYVGSINGTLVLIGPIVAWAIDLRDKFSDHVLLLGPKRPEEVPAYLVHCDFGLMLYDQSKQEIYKGQHPLKLYEYAAAGLPVLSTNHDEYEFVNPPLECVNTVNDVKPKLIQLEKNRKIRKLQMKKFAKNNDWVKVYQKASKIVEEL
jgi:glycosyltransferase involved in cell wall biosynthesis